MKEEKMPKKNSKNLDKLLEKEDQEENQNGIENAYNTESKTTYITVLTQALKSSDGDSLKNILSEKDETIIRNTLSKLSSKIVIKLIGAIIDRLESYPGESGNQLKWLKWILRENFSIQNQNKDDQDRLKNAQKVLSLKEGSLSNLISLKGKQDFVLGEKEKVKKNLGKSKISDLKPIIVFEEGESAQITQHIKLKEKSKATKKQANLDDSITDDDGMDEEGDFEEGYDENLEEEDYDMPDEFYDEELNSEEAADDDGEEEDYIELS